MKRTTSFVSTGSRIAALLLLASGFLGARPAAAYYAGGGNDANKGNDCLIGYNGLTETDLDPDAKKPTIECTDCDPTCDFDGEPTINNSCTFKIGVCLNQETENPLCERPPNGLNKATAKYKAKGKGGVKGEIALTDPAKLMGSACGAFVPLTNLLVTLKEKKDGTFKSNSATFNLSGLVNKDKVAGTPKRKDKDKLTYVCLPRPLGDPCPYPPKIFSFVTGEPTGDCGSVRSGGSAGTVRKTLRCGGLNVGGGNSTVAEGPTPDNAETQMNIDCTESICTVSERTAAETGDPTNCSAKDCPFGPYLPIANSGASTCVRNTFSSPASGTLEIAPQGTFTGAFPLTSTVYLTANSEMPCPLCVNGTPGVTDSGTCQTATQWTSVGGPSPDAGNPCTPVNATGNTHDCTPPPAVQLTPFAVNLDPITTRTARFCDAGGRFCPGPQATPGAFGCAGTGNPNAICPGGNTPPVPDCIDEVGEPTDGPLELSVPQAAKLVSVFCIPDAGNPVINGAANLPGPGATSLPGTFTILPEP